MKITVEVRIEALGPNRYRVIGVRPDGSTYFSFDGLWSSSAAEQKAEDHLRKTNPTVKIQWHPKPGIEEVGKVLYRGFVFVPGHSE